MKKNKKKHWKIIRTIFYGLIFLFGAYLMITESNSQYVTKKSLCGVTLCVIGFCLFFWDLARLYFSMKILHKNTQNTKTVLERTAEKTEAASKEAKNLLR